MGDEKNTTSFAILFSEIDGGKPFENDVVTDPLEAAKSEFYFLRYRILARKTRKF